MTRVIKIKLNFMQNKSVCLVGIRVQSVFLATKHIILTNREHLSIVELLVAGKMPPLSSQRLRRRSSKALRELVMELAEERRSESAPEVETAASMSKSISQ